MNRNTNDLLMLGITILAVGLLLMSYSISSYRDVKSIATKIDFDELDNNVQMSTSDKYFKYLSNADYLNQKLNKNKDLIIKNSSCVYLDYAHHNAVALYKLTYNGLQTEESRKSVAAGNIRGLYNMLDNYRTCKQTPGYKTELKNILNDIQKSDILYSQREDRMESFMNGYNPNTRQDQTQEAAIAGDSPSGTVQTETSQNSSQNYPEPQDSQIPPQ